GLGTNDFIVRGHVAHQKQSFFSRSVLLSFGLAAAAALGVSCSSEAPPPGGGGGSGNANTGGAGNTGTGGFAAGGTGGVATCAVGLQMCNGACVNTLSDPANCGT